MKSKLKEQSKFYDKYWDELKPISSYKLKRVIKILEYLDFIGNPRKDMDLLDLGCGDGRLLAIWQPMVKMEVGLDLSKIAMDRASKIFPFTDFYYGDACNTEFRDESFDIVISQEVIEHIEEQERYIDEIHRLLRKGGFLILTTPNKYYFDRRKGGNYSNQPIENIIDITSIKNLLHNQFKVHILETIISAKGHYGLYRIVDNKYFQGFLTKTLGHSFINKLKNRLNLGVHICLLASKKDV